MNRDAEIFAEAIELSAAERGPFLDAACAGDADLRRRVDLLLAGYEAAGLFMEQSPIERPALPPEERIGARIGRYSLVRKLGEGGCGVVYLADQHEPVRRQVALKIIKLGMDTRSVIARFEAERQALALMDHPDIARVFDAGATDSGRPYFAMEFVDGVPITKFCDEQSLGLAARLELFSRVCVALQHAHQKGIIHRDIKPSNILVTLRDGEPAPKVIDFGIAKATQGRLTEQTLLTGFDQFIGTPAYMSPEQAELRDFDIDTRSDIYSLGVLLYELLTGRAPYDTKSLIRAGVDEIRRIIREVDPPRPSTRVGTLADPDLATVARLRQAPPARLRGSIRGDLDWIVMRCLEKDRGRRYGTAVELAEDVRRHLRQEPILARRPGALYIARKFVARNRLACASAAAVAAALIVGTIVSTRQAIRATRAERVAQAESAEARRQREQAEALLTFMLGNFRQELEKLGKLELLDSVGVQALAYIASLDPQKLSDVALTRQAKALTQIGDVRFKQARFAEARESFNNAYKRAAALATRHPKNADMLFERAQAEFWIGYAAMRQGDLNLAGEWFAHYRDSAAQLVALEGKTPRAQKELTSSQHNLATLDYQRRNLDAAERGFRDELVAINEMLAADPENNSLRHRVADVASWLGWTEEARGRFAAAIG
ncbi:MAG TPA: serine/threonine-protein kinase, partial [Opitutaceae bacterium]